MTIIVDSEPGTENTLYSVQLFNSDTDRWTTIVDVPNEWSALEIYKEWSESSTEIYRVIAISYKVDIIESEVPEFN